MFPVLAPLIACIDMAARQNRDQGFLDIQLAIQQLQRGQRIVEQAREIEVSPEEQDDDDPVADSPIYEYIKAGNQFSQLTNFYLPTIEAIWRPVDAIMKGEKHRDPNFHTTTMDHVLLYLTWLKSAADYTLLAHLFQMSPRRIEDDLNRVRFALLASLAHHWWHRRLRPRYIRDSPLPPVGLIIGGHSTEIGRPRGSVQDVKVYYDGKNGVKHEVAVHASSPHYCLFVSKGVPASRKDYDLHKEVFQNYVEYLHVTPNELAYSDTPRHSPYWYILADKGYTGSNDDTEPLKRIVPKRGSNLSEDERQLNLLINRQRVVIEQFFGRLAALWTVFANTWRHDHKHLDIDFAIACLLTNHHLESTELADEDRDLHLQLAILRRRRNEAASLQRIESERNSKRRKQRQLRNALVIQNDHRE